MSHVLLDVGMRVRTLIDSPFPDDPPKGAEGTVSFLDAPGTVEVQFGNRISSYWNYELEAVA